MHYNEEWSDFVSLDIEDKLAKFCLNNKLFDIIYAQQFDKNFLEEIFVLADKIRSIAKTYNGLIFLRSLLADKRAMLFFVQPSTRTFMSFLNACHILGLQTTEIRDSSTSSEIKGESSEDSIQTFSSYVDLIITRHFNEGFAEKSAWVLNTHAKRSVPVINGGSGKDQHPTQALLDIYTINRAFKNLGGIENKTYVMVGDLKRGRTVRSLTYLLALYQNINLIFVAPKNFTMQQDVLDFLDKNKIKYKTTDNFEESIKIADAIYMTRIQDEHDTENESTKYNLDNFCLKESHLSTLKKDAIIMHPFPRRNEIEVMVDKDKRALYWKQARNGMWIRAALILYLFNREHWIDNYI